MLNSEEPIFYAGVGGTTGRRNPPWGGRPRLTDPPPHADVADRRQSQPREEKRRMTKSCRRTLAPTPPAPIPLSSHDATDRPTASNHPRGG
jgi:hypothetical protein